MATEYGLLINYEYCTGCHSCEVACQMEHGLPTDRWGIKVVEVGPWHIGEDAWQFDYVPIPTDQCDLCADRVAADKRPTCVKHCQAAVMDYGLVEELATRIKGKGKCVLFVPTAGTVG
ncbi:MAG: oxidoreductase [Coriobacteriia bacterium]